MQHGFLYSLLTLIFLTLTRMKKLKIQRSVGIEEIHYIRSNKSKETSNKIQAVVSIKDFGKRYLA